jgi:hypothetical protein
MPNNNDYYLKVFVDKSELVRNGDLSTFYEGDMSEEAKARYRTIEEKLESGYLEDLITSLRENPESGSVYELDVQHKDLIKRMVDSVTSEIGRAIIGLSILQLAVKSIVPEQSIRLHKGGGGTRNFSWKEGVSMRSLDKRYITPILRRHDLLHLNADGFMMTRSLAENYPYSKVYKAQLRGARNQWLDLVEAVEDGNLEPLGAMKYLISLLINRADDFKKLASESLKLSEEVVKHISGKSGVLSIIEEHISKSDYAARLMEISMHSLMQALQELKVFPGEELKPLSQMRSANKKHGNIGDVELVEDSEIVESWDAKFGKSYLRDEVEELSEKLKRHESVKVAGFVTDTDPQRLDEMKKRISEIEELHGLRIVIERYSDWVNEQFDRADKEVGANEVDVAGRWLTAYTESLAQKRREIAPIDEPCEAWLNSLKNILGKN